LDGSLGAFKFNWRKDMKGGYTEEQKASYMALSRLKYGCLKSVVTDEGGNVLSRVFESRRQARKHRAQVAGQNGLESRETRIRRA
jgi:hypothetical protein